MNTPTEWEEVMDKHFRILRHSLTMVGRTLRSYALLSVTIVLSFSLLLGYLGFVDSEIYNEYKYIFQINRGNLKVSDGTSNSKRFDTLIEKVSQREDTNFYTVHHSWSRMTEMSCTHGRSASISCLAMSGSSFTISENRTQSSGLMRSITNM